MPGLYQPSESEFDPSTDGFVSLFLSKERRYKHFDLPLRECDRKLNIDFTQETKPHRFWPLLGYSDEIRQYVRTKNDNGDWLRDKDGKFVRSIKEKSRPIRFASHKDAAYLEAYAAYLSGFYERALAKDGTSDSVLAYRKGGGTNIHHAESLFDEIVQRGDCSVFAMDISSFFDDLDHMMLRDEIAKLIGVDRLDGHHGTVWKNMTRYSWVETVDLDKVLGRKRISISGSHSTGPGR